MYSFDPAALDALRRSAPWSSNPRHFTSVAISPTAIMKMMMHCQSGVEKGLRSKGGNPVEVMGLLMGRPDVSSSGSNNKSLIVTDAFPLPVEGFETRVVADDEDVVNHMIALGESTERTRREKFMGWYHSHPFDLGPHSHCFLSQTDLSTQLQWQRAEDPYGNPFLAIVVDPLRSMARSTPELRAFRAYPPEYNSPVANECPDGSIVPDEQSRLEHWGSCWSRYYELEVSYFMGESARHVMTTLTKNYLWMRTLGTTPSLDGENRREFPGRLTAAADRISSASAAAQGNSGSSHQMRGMGYGMTVSTSTSGSTSTAGGAAAAGGGKSSSDHASSSKGASATTAKDNPPAASSTSKDYAEAGGDLGKACRGIVEIATERLHGDVVQVTKKELFS